MLSYAALAFTGCLCIASASQEWTKKPISYSSVSYGGPSATSYSSYYPFAAYAPQTISTYSSYPASSEMLKYNAIMPQMSWSMPWMAKKMDESDKVSIMPMMAYGASYAPTEQWSKPTWFQQELTQTHPISTPLKPEMYKSAYEMPIATKTYAAPEYVKTELTQTHPISTPLAYKAETYSAPEYFKTELKQTIPIATPLAYKAEPYTQQELIKMELKQTHPMSTPLTYKAEPYTSMGWAEGVMPIHQKVENMPIAVSKTSFTVDHKDTPMAYTSGMEGKYMMPISYETYMPEKEHYAMPMASSKSMFSMKHGLETPASTSFLAPSAVGYAYGFDASKYPFSYSSY